MNLAEACVDAQVGGNNSPFFLVHRFIALWWIAFVLQPWSTLIGRGYGTAVIGSLLSGVVYSLLWLALCRFAAFRRFALRIDRRHAAIAVAIFAIPYLILFSYALYMQYYEPPPPPPA